MERPIQMKSSAKYWALTVTVAVFLFLLNGVKVQDIVATAFGYRGAVPMFALDKMLFGYSPAQAYNVITAYGPTGRRAYATLLLTLDMLFPFLYGSFLFLSLRSVSLGAGFSKRWAGWLGGMGFAAAGCDCLENVCFLSLMAVFPGQSVPVARAASFFTVTKFLLSGISVVALLVVGIYVLYRMLRRSPQAHSVQA